MDQAFERVDRSLERRLDDIELILGDRFQHVVRRILAWCWSPDSDFESNKLRGPQCLDDRLDAVVASMPAGLFDPEAAWLQIQIVVDENQIVDGELQLAQKAFERRARDVHEVESAGEFNQLRS